MAKPLPDIGDLVRVINRMHDDPKGVALVIEKDVSGWLRLTYPEAEGEEWDRWYPPAKLVVISRGCEKEEEK